MQNSHEFFNELSRVVARAHGKAFEMWVTLIQQGKTDDAAAVSAKMDELQDASEAITQAKLQQFLSTAEQDIAKLKGMSERVQNHLRVIKRNETNVNTVIRAIGIFDNIISLVLKFV